jgi:hypothetical protein
MEIGCSALVLLVGQSQSATGSIDDSIISALETAHSEVLQVEADAESRRQFIKPTLHYVD